MKKKILLVLTILFGLMMVNSGLNKLFNYMPAPELTPEQMTIFGAFGTIKWVLPFVAIIEILGGILIAIPRYRALGAIVILPVMLGIVVHHATHDPATIGIALVMLAINLWAIADNWSKYKHLVK
ncbi:DoxX family membrane protein [Parapedobacter sp. DT-150]|uniref:DoxX family membrane protein n=1 Tax=Parapedobacter sp. DT-150 TaxID=3396162 RepID=UPI003F1AB092